MYLEHFGLREAPFRITPHSGFFFAGAKRGATLDALAYAITHDEGIVKVSGEVGSGKTMLCRMLIEKLPASVETVFLANPSLSREDLLFAIASELKAPLPEERTRLLLGALEERLREIHAAGRDVVVMVDEAHAAPQETLEEIRLLSNLEANGHKLAKIVLFGQPELNARLSDPTLRQLRERITHNFALEPLRRDDVGAYLMFRLRAAGYRGPDLFTPVALQLISDASEGLTRRINILADKALQSAFNDGGHLVDNRQARAAITEAQFGPMPKVAAPPWATRLGISLATAVVLAAAGYWLLPLNPPAPPVAVADSNTTVAAIPAADAATATPAGSPATSAAQNANATDIPPPSAGIPDRTSDAAPNLDERITETADWLRKTPATHYFIQLSASDAADRATAERHLDEALKLLDPQQVRAYRSALSGRDRIGIIYGDYATPALGEAALAQLPPAIREKTPYLRQVRKLR
ncbi:AAA family ATPase [Rhodocyclus gracilis]|uniref:AAA family ATPase n=1 Tax=Rhodocyclus tenuis TaxID=1066 RepID=A0A6L5JZW0_RHOTE|nr:AAA family ATPase [Rhodocyclus gracilis]MQY52621.1 AAA family ATPase [Rhodocyclus gracilis]